MRQSTPTDAGSGVADASVIHTDDSAHKIPSLTEGYAAQPGTWTVVSVYQGQEDYGLYARDGSGLTPISVNSIRAGEAVILPEDTIHDLSTSASQPTCSIHVYGGDLYDAQRRSMWAPPELRETKFNEREFTRSWPGARHDHHCELINERAQT